MKISEISQKNKMRLTIIASILSVISLGYNNYIPSETIMATMESVTSLQSAIPTDSVITSIPLVTSEYTNEVDLWIDRIILLIETLSPLLLPIILHYTNRNKPLSN